MQVEITGVHHVKVPVTDLLASASWYASLLGLRPVREFVENGVLRGVALRHPGGGFVIALREREVCASRPDLAGFDPFALQVADRGDLLALVGRCEQLGVAHGEVVERGSAEAVVDVPDPDGTVVRFLWSSGEHEEAFVGLEFSGAADVGFYDRPRLRLDEERPGRGSAGE